MTITKKRPDLKKKVTRNGEAREKREKMKRFDPLVAALIASNTLSNEPF